MSRVKPPTATTDHPALASAKRAIRRHVATLRPELVFRVAAIVELLATGRENGAWSLSAEFAAEQPDYVWKCDAPSVTGRTR
jgi:hypothetical protein